MRIKALSESLRNSRFYPLLWLAAIYLLVSSTTRIALYIHSLSELDAPVQQFFMAMSIGLFYDLVTCLYLFAFYALYLFLVTLVSIHLAPTIYNSVEPGGYIFPDVSGRGGIFLF